MPLLLIRLEAWEKYPVVDAVITFNDLWRWGDLYVGDVQCYVLCTHEPSLSSADYLSKRQWISALSQIQSTASVEYALIDAETGMSLHLQSNGIVSLVYVSG